MGILISSLIYYLVGSVIAGSVMGAGFATNLGRRASKDQLQTLQKLGNFIPLRIDGVEGDLIAKPNEQRPTIIYVHGRSANRTEMAPLARALFEQGYNAVLWDGKSRQISYGPDEINQTLQIISSIRTDPHVRTDRIYVVGFSLGAAIAIGAAASDADGSIQAIVADSPYANLKNVATRYVRAFGVIPEIVAWPAQTMTLTTAKVLHGIDFDTRNPADWAERVMCPVLLIHGRSDKRIPPTHSEEIFERLHTRKELWLVDDAGHTQNFAVAAAEYVRRVVAFLQ